MQLTNPHTLPCESLFFNYYVAFNVWNYFIIKILYLIIKSNKDMLFYVYNRINVHFLI